MRLLLLSLLRLLRPILVRLLILHRSSLLLLLVRLLMLLMLLMVLLVLLLSTLCCRSSGYSRVRPVHLFRSTRIARACFGNNDGVPHHAPQLLLLRHLHLPVRADNHIFMDVVRQLCIGEQSYFLHSKERGKVARECWKTWISGTSIAKD